MLIIKFKYGDYIYFDNSLLKEKNATYTFGDLESKYGRPNLSLDDSDVIKIEARDREIYLKRLYG